VVEALAAATWQVFWLPAHFRREALAESFPFIIWGFFCLMVGFILLGIGTYLGTDKKAAYKSTAIRPSILLIQTMSF
jgi:hypothetical protein